MRHDNWRISKMHARRLAGTLFSLFSPLWTQLRLGSLKRWRTVKSPIVDFWAATINALMRLRQYVPAR